jgi:hypothetical protein
MRVRIVLAVVLLLAGSAAILVLRSVLLDRLDEEIEVRLRQRLRPPTQRSKHRERVPRYLTVMSRAMAMASWARWWPVRRSVLRRS